MVYIACDIGGTNGRTVAYESLDSTTPLGSESFRMQRLLNADYPQLVQACHVLGEKYGDIEGVGLAVAGKIDSARRILTMSGNLGDWVDKPVQKLLSDHLHCEVVLGNDAEAAALAEAVYGLGTQEEYTGQDFFGMIWGTGVGGACVRYAKDGSFLTIPGEPGHIQLDDSVRALMCGCGGLGHLEAYCGGANIPRVTRRTAEELCPNDWRFQILPYMAMGIRNVLRVQPVSLIVFSGGIACKQPWLLPVLEEMLDQPQYGSPKVRLSMFGESAGTLGALALLSL